MIKGGDNTHHGSLSLELGEAENGSSSVVENVQELYHSCQYSRAPPLQFGVPLGAPS